MSRISNILKLNIKRPALIDTGHIFLSAINTEYNEDYIYYIGTSGSKTNLLFAFSTINATLNSTLLVDKTGTRVLNFNPLNIITTES